MNAATSTARRTLRSTLVNAGLRQEIANVIARHYDPALMDVQRYLGRVLNGVERAMDAQPVSRCERIARTA